MHVLLTGATGFIGQRLCRQLQSLGHELTVVSRGALRASSALAGVRAIDWSGLDAVGALEDVDAVIHLDGETVTGRWNAAKRERVRNSRLQTTRRVVDAIARSERRPGVLICASGIGVYGDGGDAPLVESSPAGDDFFARLCVDWEAIAEQAEAGGTRVVLARFGIVVGVGGGAIGAMLRPTGLGIGGPLGSGQQWWSWIHLDDAVSALCHLLMTPSARGPVNLVAPEPIRQSDFASILGVAMARPGLLPAPAFALRLVLGDFALEVLSSKRVLPRKLDESGFNHQHPKLMDALGDVLGPPRPVRPWLPLLAVATLGLAPLCVEDSGLGRCWGRCPMQSPTSGEVRT